MACYAVGFDPMMGFYHQPRFGRPALALDLMEPFRALIVDSAVVSAINNRMVTPRDFVSVAQSVALTAEGRKAFYRAYELRMDTRQTVARWAQVYRGAGREGLKKAGRAGRKPQLQEQDRKRLIERLREGPEALGYETPLWTCPRVAHLIQEEFGFPTMPGTYGKY